MRIKKLPVVVNLQGGESIRLRIVGALREAIEDRRLSPGDALPSSRDLARQLGVARNTVLGAIARLIDEGILETKPGAGTFVKQGLIVGCEIPDEVASPFTLTDWAQRLPDDTAIRGSTGAPLDLLPGLPDLGAIPFDEWRRSGARKMKTSRTRLASYGPPEGHEDLRAEIARHVARSRGIACHSDDVIVTTGAQQAFDLVSRVLIRPGAKIAVEDPGYPPAAQTFLAAGAVLCAVPVDVEGLEVSRVPDDAAMVYVTPSHQFPLGVTLSDERRRDLLAWASRRQAFIIEDDYDSEYRFTNCARPALRASDAGNRVIHVGTFSKSLMPGIRLGYLIVPRGLRKILVTAKWLSESNPASISQSVLAEFMHSGGFSRHVAKMRELYAGRYAVLAQHREGFAQRRGTLLPSDGGLHACLLLPPHRSEESVIAAASRNGVGLYGLRRFFVGPATYSGLILGFGNVNAKGIEFAVGHLLDVLGHDAP